MILNIGMLSYIFATFSSRIVSDASSLLVEEVSTKVVESTLNTSRKISATSIYISRLYDFLAFR
ncbi:MAG: hypothetical protein H0W50_11180 [Parachlamydiaceae bacterium]|nr:hypothetical protein [Parachlamydiaceae bacterium]